MAIWAIVPAAGSGRRMQSTAPKQYLDLDGEPVLLHTLRRLAELDGLQGIVLVLRENDQWWSSMAAEATGLPIPLMICEGGEERFQSVSNGLAALEDRATDEDWVLVHDAARPCVRVTDMLRLVDVAGSHASGGILATPVRDTLKRGDASHGILHTVDRSDLWSAQTPQMFRHGRLREALRLACQGDRAVTDEASAMELAGHAPLLVMGSADNIKVTWPGDLLLARLVLQAQRQESESTPGRVYASTE